MCIFADYYLNEKQMSAPPPPPAINPLDDYLVPSPPQPPPMFENPEYFEGDPRDSVFEVKTPPVVNDDSRKLSVKPKVAPKPRRLTDYYNDLGKSVSSSQSESERLLSNTSNCSSNV